MLMALNEKREPIEARYNLSKNEIYLCPACQKDVILKQGKIMRPHFAHSKNQACDSVFSEGETREHLDGKKQLEEWLRGLGYEVQLEAYLPRLKQRPDLLVIAKSQTIAIEFQCSGLPIERVVERTNGYLNAGIEVIWILGKNFTLKNTLTAFHKATLSRIGNQLCLLEYDTEKKKMTIRSDFCLKADGQIEFQEQKLNQEKLDQYSPFKEAKWSIPSIDFKRRHEELVRWQTPFQRKFMELLYVNHENMVTMPLELYYILPSEWMILDYSYEWKYRFVLWLEGQSAYKVITKKTIHKWIKNERIEYALIPQAREEDALIPFYEWLFVLEKAGAVKERGDKKWTVESSLKRYKYLEEKLQIENHNHG